MTTKPAKGRDGGKVDAVLGDDLRRWIVACAEARGLTASQVLRHAAAESRLRDLTFAHQVSAAVVDLHAAAQPDDRYDPADDPRPAAALSALASLLGSLPAALGVQSALAQIAAAPLE